VKVRSSTGFSLVTGNTLMLSSLNCDNSKNIVLV
jgi:hypothetical protein